MGEEYVPFAAFAGGEPLVTPDLWKVLERCCQRGLQVTLATNGTLLTPEMCERLKAAQVKYVELSLDSLDPEQHDEVRSMNGAWARTVQGIRNSVAAGIRTGMACCFTRHTANSVDDMVKFAIELGCNTFSHFNFIPVGRGRGIIAEDMTPAQRELLLQKLQRHLEESKITVVSTAPQFGRACILYGAEEGLFATGHAGRGPGKKTMVLSRYIGGCGTGRCYCAIQPNGIITPCVYMAGIKVGDLRQRTLAQIWKNPLFATLSDREDRGDHCGVCDYRHYCGGCRGSCVRLHRGYAGWRSRLRLQLSPVARLMRRGSERGKVGGEGFPNGQCCDWDGATGSLGCGHRRGSCRRPNPAGRGTLRGRGARGRCAERASPIPLPVARLTSPWRGRLAPCAGTGAAGARRPHHSCPSRAGSRFISGRQCEMNKPDVATIRPDDGEAGVLAPTPPPRKLAISQTTLSTVGDLSVAATDSMGRVTDAPHATRWFPVVAFFLVLYVATCVVTVFSFQRDSWFRAFFAPLLPVLVATATFWWRQRWKLRAKSVRLNSENALGSLSHEASSAANAIRANLSGFRLAHPQGPPSEPLNAIERAQLFALTRRCRRRTVSLPRRTRYNSSLRVFPSPVGRGWTATALSPAVAGRVRGHLRSSRKSRISSRSQENAMDYTYEDIAKMIDHSLLNPGLTDIELEQGCQEAVDYNCATVCIMPYYLKRCAEILRGSTVRPSTTIGFPHGGHTTAIKVAEAKQALADGGEELDMVVNISKVLSRDWAYVRHDLKAVIDLTHDHGRRIKVIFENCYLKDEHKIRLCEICAELRADWVKNSTGYGSGGATPWRT